MVFSLIKEDRNISLAEMRGELSTVKRKIKTLKHQGMLERIGSDKTGYWKIITK
jgi:predicted HTH transcriptional regulator